MFNVLARTVLPVDARVRQTNDVRRLPDGLMGVFIIEPQRQMAVCNVSGERLLLGPEEFRIATGVDQEWLDELLQCHPEPIPYSITEDGQPIHAVATYRAPNWGMVSEELLRRCMSGDGRLLPVPNSDESATKVKIMRRGGVLLAKVVPGTEIDSSVPYYKSYLDSCAQMAFTNAFPVKVAGAAAVAAVNEGGVQ
jgi:hypothetical protein